MEKNALITKYKSARWMILFTIVIFIINAATILSGKEPLMKSIAMPKLSLLVGELIVGQDSAYLIVLLCSAIAIGLYILSYIKSKTNYKWLLPSIIIFGIDTLYLIYYVAFSTSDYSSILDTALEIWVLAALYRGYGAGRALDNDFEEIDLRKDNKKKSDKVYEFDAQMSKNNKCDCLLGFVLSFVFFIFLLLSITYGYVGLQDVVSEELRNTLFMAASLIVFGSYFFYLYKVYPYLTASNYYYYLQDGKLTRFSITTGSVTSFEKAYIYKDKDKCYVVKYQGKKRERKLIIPKCYRQIEKILKKAK